MEKQQALVSVCMITYNHEQYIREAIEGVLMQKTNFPVELIIGEDCSTDNTRVICLKYYQRYPEIIRLQLPDKNKGSMKNFIENMQAANGKYIALCEGDDYWTDPYKLQKQVDFLEVNEDYGMCCSNYYVLKNNICTDYFNFYGEDFFKQYGLYRNTKIQDISLELLLKHNFIGTLTVMFRKKLIEVKYLSIEMQYKMGDYPLWLEFARKMKIAKLPDYTAVYRFLEESASHTNDEFKSYVFSISVIDLRYDFAKKNNLLNFINTEDYIKQKKHQLGYAFQIGNKKLFLSAYNRLKECDPEYIIFSRKIKKILIQSPCLYKTIGHILNYLKK